MFLALLHALLDLAGRAAPDGDPLTVLGHLLRAVTGGVRLVQLLRRPAAATGAGRRCPLPM